MSELRICPGCEQPMITGKQLFNGILQCHWDCTDATRDKMGHAEADEFADNRIKMRLAQDGIFKGHPLYEKLGGK